MATLGEAGDPAWQKFKASQTYQNYMYTFQRMGCSDELADNIMQGMFLQGYLGRCQEIVESFQ